MTEDGVRVRKVSGLGMDCVSWSGVTHTAGAEAAMQTLDFVTERASLTEEETSLRNREFQKKTRKIRSQHLQKLALPLATAESSFAQRRSRRSETRETPPLQRSASTSGAEQTDGVREG